MRQKTVGTRLSSRSYVPSPVDRSAASWIMLRPFPSRVRKMPLGTFCVFREGFNTIPVLHHTIRSTSSVPAPDCQPEQWRLYALNVGMKQMCLF